MTRPVRTLLYSTLYPSSARPGHGIFVETRLRELLRLGGVETRVVAPVPWFPFKGERYGEYGRMAATPQRETRNGIDVLHPRYPLIPKAGMTTAPFLLAAASLGAIRKMQREGFDFDVIDAHYFYPDGVAAALLAKWLSKPLTITARGTDLNLIPQHALPRRMIEWAARRADASIGVCQALMDVLKDWDIEPSRLHVFRNGVDLQRFHPEPPAASRRQLGISDGPVLLSVGHLIERKGHHLVIDAMPAIRAVHPRAQLLVVGAGDMQSALVDQVRRLGLQGVVRLAGAVPNDQLANWYSAADAMVLASSREGWANVLLEAMACGTPVVATKIWGTPEVVSSDAVGVLVEQRTPQALAVGILRLLAQPPVREDVRRYAEGFSWVQTSMAQKQLFSRLSAAAKEPPR